MMTPAHWTDATADERDALRQRLMRQVPDDWPLRHAVSALSDIWLEVQLTGLASPRRNPWICVLGPEDLYVVWYSTHKGEWYRTDSLDTWDQVLGALTELRLGLTPDDPRPLEDNFGNIAPSPGQEAYWSHRA